MVGVVHGIERSMGRFIWWGGLYGREVDVVERSMGGMAYGVILC